MTLEEEEQLFNKSFVKAVSAWSGVELHLCILFTVLVTGEAGKHINANAARVFYAIENFRSKQQMVDTVAEIVVQGELLKEWKTIEGHLGKRAKRRNSIIHGEVRRSETAPSGKRIGVGLPMLSSSSTPIMYIHDLQVAESEFTELAKNIVDFIDRFQEAIRSQ
jgi:hypothetical protein